MTDIILKADNIFYGVENKKGFNTYESFEILKHISFEIERGSVLGVSGESGSGKSTLAKLLAGIIKPTSGNITINYKKDWSISSVKPVQLLFQNGGEILNPFRVVEDVLQEAIELGNMIEQPNSKNADDLIKQFDLPLRIKSKKCSQLSGGEQQRVALARIIAVGPEILILDEPFSSQDVESQLNLFNLIKYIKNLGVTIICVSHELNILKNLAQNILIMFKGEVVENGNTTDIFNHPKHNYTKYLLSAESLKLSYREIHSFHNNYEQD